MFPLKRRVAPWHSMASINVCLRSKAGDSSGCLFLTQSGHGSRAMKEFLFDLNQIQSSRRIYCQWT